MDSKETLIVTEDEIRAACDAWTASFSEIRKPRKHPTDDRRNSRPIPVAGKRNILITSALPYVNNVPHLGNIVGCVLSADVFTRFCHIRNYNTLYICGTDEYGTATENKAQEEGLTPRQICDKYHAIHREVYEWFNIGFDFFGRTTTPNMAKITQDVFWKLHSNGYLMEDTVDQLHCKKCDRFLADRFVEGVCPHCKFDDARGDQCDACGKLINAVELGSPRCKTCGSKPEVKTSKHIFIDLPKLEPAVTSWLEESCGSWTSNARVIGKSWLKGGLQPRCITRDLKWGTPVPMKGYEDKVFYVWFQAPFGYVSITADYMDGWEKWWKDPDNVEYYEFMAKDNVPFHSIVFPASQFGSQTSDFRWTKVTNLMATEYLNYEDAKFSKSRGIGVFGGDAKDTGIPADVWRFYLVYTRPETADSSFRWDDLALKNNSELLANLGNFVNRSAKFLKDNFEGKVSPIFIDSDDDKLLLAQVNKNLALYVEHMEKSRQRESVSFILNISRLGNKLMQSEQPWKKNKSADPKEKARAASVVSLCVNLAALIGAMLEPFMPSLSKTTLDQLNTTLEEVNPMSAEEQAPCFKCMLKPGHVIGNPAPLVREIKADEVMALKKKFAGTQSERQKAAATKLSPGWIGRLEEGVTNQGDVVRKLKEAKASQDGVAVAVEILLFLKSQLADARGETPTLAAPGKKGKKK